MSSCISINSIQTIQLSSSHEITTWEDGSITIEDPMYQYTHDEAADHVRLSADEVKALRDLLNKLP